MGEDAIEPLQRPVEVQFNPARRRRDSLAPVLGAPALDKTHADRAHSRQLVDGFESLADRLRQQGGELLVVEYFQIATLIERDKYASV